MNFTREPIIETIISPKEGYKLLVRNSKGGAGEEYFVDAVEVVSFGQAFFFRSLERPKAFIVPVSDYEIVEVKEARVALKNISYDRNIKIGGGREASLRQGGREKEIHPVKEIEPTVAEESLSSEPTTLEPAVEARSERRRDKKRHRRRRGAGSDEHETMTRKGSEIDAVSTPAPPQTDASVTESIESVPLFSSLIPPPLTLISETLNRLREKELAEEKNQPFTEEIKIEDEAVELFSDEATTASELKEEKKEKSSDKDDSTESSSMNRSLNSQSKETSSFSATLSRSLFGNKSDFYFF